MIAALYVATGGAYFNLPNVDPWDEPRDARLYAGPWPVVAHPPCERWGRYADGGPSHKGTRVPGEDGGCFAAALTSVRRWGGVLEHPADSKAWSAYGLLAPPASGGWVTADFFGGWTCCVDQGLYGHLAAKRTWLYAKGVKLPSMLWGRSGITVEPTDAEAARGRRSGVIERMSKRARIATPPAFRDLLISIAESANARRRAA